MGETDSTRINPAHLRALVAVADVRNFSQAALDLQISQSAVSYAIATLEAELGVVLVTRGRHGATLTPVGEKIVEQSRHILQRLESIVQAANVTKGLQGGSLRIACFRSVATHILPALLIKFCTRFPKIAIRLTECAGAAEVEQALREGQVDLGFTILPTNQEFEVEAVVYDEYLVLLPPTARVPSTGLTWDAIADYSFITCLTNTCHSAVYKHLAEWKVSLRVVFDVQESSTAVSMVARGLGAAILARLSALPIPPEVQVHRLPVPLKRVICVAVLANIMRTPAMFAFLDTLSISESDEVED